MAEIIRNEKGRAVGVVLFESGGVAAIYDIPGDHTYIEITGAIDLTKKKAKALRRTLGEALRAAK